MSSLYINRITGSILAGHVLFPGLESIFKDLYVRLSCLAGIDFLIYDGKDMESVPFPGGGPAENVVFYRHLAAAPDVRLVMSRLGRRSATVVDAEVSGSVAADVARGAALCSLSGAFLRVPVQVAPDSVLLPGGIRIPGMGLASLLAGCASCALMACTAGHGVSARIASEMASGHAARAVVLDAVASELADGGLNAMLSIQAAALSREGRVFTSRRFSPGYGDLPVSVNRLLFPLLRLDQLDMALTDADMLVPEKSVIAIAGITERSPNG
jgi:hypothetical protein